jgi:hypothetical protein
MTIEEILRDYDELPKGTVLQEESKAERKLRMAREWKVKNRDKVLEANRKRNAARYADPVARAKKLLSDSECRKRHLDERRAYDRSRDKAKVNARNAVRVRIYRGKLTRRPCEVCGKPNAHAHHEDYGNPFKVKWLCSTHHSGVHHGK